MFSVYCGLLAFSVDSLERNNYIEEFEKREMYVSSGRCRTREFVMNDDARDCSEVSSGK